MKEEFKISYQFRYPTKNKENSQIYRYLKVDTCNYKCNYYKNANNDNKLKVKKNIRTKNVNFTYFKQVGKLNIVSVHLNNYKG